MRMAQGSKRSRDRQERSALHFSAESNHGGDYVADRGNKRVVKIAADGTLHVVANLGACGKTGFF